MRSILPISRLRMQQAASHPIAKNFPFANAGKSIVIQADCLDWMASTEENSIHAIVTDPPYGVKEYEHGQIERLQNGNKGGIWRLPPVLNGVERSPLPRFTALSPQERLELVKFFTQWSTSALRILRPGAHVFVASNSFLSQEVFSAIVSGGLEFRGEIIRLVSTLRGGDRPKLHEKEFPDVCSLPRGSYEPWGVFRKPLPAKMRAGECLRKWQTGGIRRKKDGSQFLDVISSERTPQAERAVADHPSLKPLSFMRELVYAALPLGEGVILDTFSGSGSTLAACELEELSGIGIEKNPVFFQGSLKSIPALVELRLDPQIPLKL
jgi:site-specific DNA-methyltransferase (adenine-specific)